MTLGLFVVVLAVNGATGGNPASAVTPSPTPGPNSVQSLRVDTDPTGNGPGPSGMGPTEACVSIDVDQTVAVDVMVELLPPVFAFPGAGLSGFGFNVLYNQAVVNATAEHPLTGISMLTSVGSSSITSSGDAFPDSDGDLKIVKLDGSTNYEYGSGTLIRLDFTGVAPGESTLTLGDTNAGNGDGIPNVYRSDGAAYEVGSLWSATIMVGSQCPTPTPAPVTDTPIPTTPPPTTEPTTPGPETPTPSPPVTPTPFPGTQTPGPGTPSPTPVGTPTPVGSPTPTASGTPIPSPTPAATPSPGAAQKGDFNCDGKITLRDVFHLLYYAVIAEPLPHPANCPEIGTGSIGDLNCDGVIDHRDVGLLLRYVLGLTVPRLEPHRVGCTPIGS